ncbi:MAG: L-threonylcarbamoyladenylate synthase [Candidatus Vogelbacteria bacterium]|nr:L-threonylcarbamoyladenylate synthase [Candidatus Vogelbacteria bacterium]
MFPSEIVGKINSGGVGILPTDTICGLSGSALSPAVVERIYELKQRPADMPFIVLIGEWEDLGKLGVEITEKDRAVLEKNWPGSISFILPCPDPENKLEYLHRGKKTIAVRFPIGEDLQKLLAKTGPLISTSANLSGRRPAETIEEARDYFGNRVDFYLDAGPRGSQPSTLAKLTNGQVEILRQGDTELIKN